MLVKYSVGGNSADIYIIISLDIKFTREGVNARTAKDFFL